MSNPSRHDQESAGPLPPQRGATCGPLRVVAAMIEPLYAAATRRRNRRYDSGRRPIHRAHCPVISIGNLTAGGTGKTPMVIHVCQRLGEHGYHPAVVLRGYRAQKTGGSDEAALLSERLPQVPIIINADRVAAVKALAQQHPHVNMIVLDDAFQHRRIGRDLDVVLIDATDPFGGDHVLPRGRMREPPEGLRRADAVVVTHADALDSSANQQLDERIARYHGRPPIAHAAHVWSQIVDQNDALVTDTDARVFAFCGIGNPQAFFAQAQQRFSLAGYAGLPDHHAYSAYSVNALRSEARRHHADALLTTEKDWVKLRRLLESQPIALPVWRPRLCIEFRNGTGAFEQLVLDAATRASGPS